MNYGYFVSVTDNLQGLLHVSSMKWNNDRNNVKINIGDTVKVKIIGIDFNLRRLALSIKDCLPGPYTEFAERHSVGSIINCKVTSIASFGVFFEEFSQDIDTDVKAPILVHGSDIINSIEARMKEISSFDKSSVREIYPIGHCKNLIITSINVESNRIAASMNLVTASVLKSFIKNSDKEVSSKIVGVTPATILTSIQHEQYTISCLVPISKIVGSINEYKIDQIIQASIVRVDYAAKLVILHMNKTDNIKSKDTTSSNPYAKNSLGSMIQDKLKEK
jgi:small subunit ribosomal protein S1